MALSIISINRTKNYLTQIKGAISYKVLAMASSFLAVPILIQYLGQEVYGVWSTLLTVLSWLVFFDFGIGNGIRNKVAEALAAEQPDRAKDYIATGFGIIGLISAALLVIAMGLIHSLSWQIVLKTRLVNENELRIAVYLVAFFVILNFWFGTINSIAGAVQRSGMVALGQMLANLTILLLVFLLSRAADASLIYIALAYGFSITLSNAALITWFCKAFPALRTLPRIVKQHISHLSVFGIQFFVIQISVLVIFTTDKILIVQLLGPEYIAQYDVVTKLFGIVVFAHSMINAPLWSAYTDAFQRKDFLWIEFMLKKQYMVFAFFCGMTLFTGLLFDEIVSLWVGDMVHVSSSLVQIVGVFTIVSVWNNMQAMVSNGIGKIKLQMWTALAAMVLNIPLALLFVNILQLGIEGVVLSNIACLLLGGIALPIQIKAMLKSGIMSVNK